MISPNTRRIVVDGWGRNCAARRRLRLGDNGAGLRRGADDSPPTSHDASENGSVYRPRRALGLVTSNIEIPWRAHDLSAGQLGAVVGDTRGGLTTPRGCDRIGHLRPGLLSLQATMICSSVRICSSENRLGRQVTSGPARV